MKTRIIKLTPNADYGNAVSVHTHHADSIISKAKDAQDYIEIIHKELSMFTEDESLVKCGQSQILSFSIDDITHVFKITTK